MSIDVGSLLAKTAYRRMDVEALLDKGFPSWVRFDPEIGYVPDDVVMQDGIDNSRTTYTYEPGGQRKMLNYADRRCRINTYGNSYTQCQQVSDGETWQEYLAAHLGEPVRNFGCGGQGVFQCWRKMLRIDPGDEGAEHIILNIFHDDHVRSLDMARWIRSAWKESARPPDKPRQIHGLPWDHLRFDLDRGCWVERRGLCKTKEDLLDLCDPEKFYEAFKDDQIVRLFVLENGGEVDVEEFEALAEALDVKVDLRHPETRPDEALKLHLAYGFRSTEYILEQMLPWAEEQGKKVKIVLSYGRSRLPEVLEGTQRFDQMFIE